MRSLPLICAGAAVSIGALLFVSGCGTASAPAQAKSAAPASAAASQRVVPIYDITQLTIMPKLRTPLVPHFPDELRRQGIGGEVIVDFIVDERGIPRDIQAIHASQPAFGEAAVQAVANAAFTPGMMSGEPVRTHMQLPLLFNIGAPQ